MKCCFVCNKEYKKFNKNAAGHHLTYIDFPENLCKNHLEMLYHYNWMYGSTIDGPKDYKLIKKIINEEGVKTVGELGCGPAFFYSNVLSKLSIEYTGLEMRESAVKLARVLNPSIKFNQLKIYETSEHIQIYDLFFSRHVMMHQEDIHRFLECSLPYGNIVIHIQTRPFKEKHVRKHDYGKGHKFHGEKVVNHWSNVYSHEEIEEITEDFSDIFDITIDYNYLIFYRKKK